MEKRVGNKRFEGEYGQETNDGSGKEASSETTEADTHVEFVGRGLE